MWDTLVLLSWLAVLATLYRAPRPRVLGRGPWGVALPAPSMAEMWRDNFQSGAQPSDNWSQWNPVPCL